jgi:hypothetical protein
VFAAFSIVGGTASSAAISTFRIPSEVNAPLIDGVLDDEVWGLAQPYERFFEFFPLSVPEPIVRTQIRIAMDSSNLYFAVSAFDPSPDLIRAPFVRRDKVIGDQDYISIYIDPAGTRRSAQFFRVNAAGIQTDGVFNESTLNEDYSPDFAFTAATRITGTGWAAEFKIPFSSIRYPAPLVKPWTILVFRNYSRKQRHRITTSRLNANSDCILCLNEELAGVTNLPSTTSWLLTPTLSAITQRTKGARSSNEFRSGLDIKFSPNSEVVIDATIRPDFSQVEIDLPQLSSNTRFALFYPEKRPFFLEGVDILEGPMRIVNTRTITVPSAGARVTGRSETSDYTAIYVADKGGGTILIPGAYGTEFAPQDQHSTAAVARARFVFAGPTLGVVASDRRYSGGGYNSVLGADGVWNLTNQTRIRVQVLESETNFLPSESTPRLEVAPAVRGAAWFGELSYHGTHWDSLVLLDGATKTFRDDNGFFPQNDFRHWGAKFTRRFGPRGPFNELAPYVSFDHKVDSYGNLIAGAARAGLYVTARADSSLSFEVRPYERQQIFAGGGVKKFSQIAISASASPAAWMPKVTVDLELGQRPDVVNNRVANGVLASIYGQFRALNRLELEVRQDVEVANETAVRRRGRLFLDAASSIVGVFHLSRSSSIRAIGQFVRTARNVQLYTQEVSPLDRKTAVSLTYGHQWQVGRTLYFGYSTSRTESLTGRSSAAEKEIFIRFSYQI